MVLEKFGLLIGEFLVEFIIDLNVNYVEIGYVECKNFFYEKISEIVKKIKFVLDEKIILVVCVGEEVCVNDINELKNVLKK